MNQQKRLSPLQTLYAYVSEGCNLKCRHCWMDPRFQANPQAGANLDPALFRQIVDEALPLGLKRVKLTGGEPLIHPRIADLLAVVREKGLRLSMETNAVMCTPWLAREIASCRVFNISVSLDGVDAETHEWVRGVKGAFDAALTGIRNLVDAGIRPQIIMTVMRHNKDQIEPLVRLAETLGARSVKFNLVQPMLRGEVLHQRDETLPVEELIALGRWVEKCLVPATRLRLYYHQPMAFRRIETIYGKQGLRRSCSVRNLLGVLSDGTYSLCGIGENIPALRFGNARTDALERVWRDTPTLTALREGLPHRLRGICRRCVMKSRCLGSCVAQNYVSERDLFAPHWFCKEAENQGLFPASRLASWIEDETGGSAAA